MNDEIWGRQSLQKTLQAKLSQKYLFYKGLKTEIQQAQKMPLSSLN